MENVKNAINLIDRNHFMASIDIKDSHFLVAISDKHKKYLKFSFEKTIYKFNCLPFGLSVAPYVFTKLMKPVVEYLRSKNQKSVVYLDDFLLISKTKYDCEYNVRITADLLTSLGFALNYKKCQLTPAQTCTFLGFVFDTVSYNLHLPNDKRTKIFNLVKKFNNLRTCKIREAAQLVGTLISACPGSRYGFLYTKQLEMDKYLALKYSNNNYEMKMDITKRMRDDLAWWIKNVSTTNNPVRESVYACEILSDASLSGWGASCGDERINGWWTFDDKKEHINFLELKAAFYALKCFAKNRNHCEILLRVDNTTAISHLNKMGGIQREKLSYLSREIWTWCEQRNIWLFTSYINTKDNKIADEQSRITFKETEWELASWAYRKIVKKFGSFEVDLFASKANTKCPKYVSWKKDPDSIAVDAFTILWNRYYFYAFPPFAIILRVLRKIRVDKAVGVVVVPWWPTQPWFPLFTELCAATPQKFTPCRDLLISSSREPHPLSSSLSLVAAKLSGKLS